MSHARSDGAPDQCGTTVAALVAAAGGTPPGRVPAAIHGQHTPGRTDILSALRDPPSHGDEGGRLKSPNFKGRTSPDWPGAYPFRASALTTLVWRIAPDPAFVGAASAATLSPGRRRGRSA